ncbi:MAG: hypothetical protein ACI8PB_003491 [Desulforhopalus sp.]|jgi:hypothetical protein
MSNKYTGVVSCILAVTLLAFVPVIASSESVPQNLLTSKQSMSKERRVEEMSLLEQKMTEYGFGETDLNTFRDMLKELQTKELPLDPVVHKVYEGMAKNIQPDNIIHATNQVQGRYRSASRYAHLLSDTGPATGKLTETIAQAFAAGLKNEDCEDIVLELKEQIRAMSRVERNGLIEQTMWTARDMARRQVHSSTISNVLSSALRHSYQAKEMSELRQRFSTQAKRHSPENVAIEFGENIGRGAASHQLGKTSSNSNSGNSKGSSGSSGGSGGSSGSSGGSGASGGSSGGSGGSGGSSGGSGASGGSSGGSGGSGGNSGGSGGSSGSSGGGNGR